MADIIPFDFDNEQVRAVLLDTAPWWVASDIAKVLGYAHTPNMVRMLDDDEKGVHIVSTLGGDQSLSIISESGLFAAILKSRREEAQRFRRWVTGEVLPALRRHGSYTMPGATPPGPAAPDLDVPRLQVSLGIVREARRLFGPTAARAMWLELGLPAPCGTRMVGGSLSDTAAGDPLLTDVRAFLAEREAVTVEDVAVAIGLDLGTGMKQRFRIGRMLRWLGWTYKAEHLAGVGKVNMYRPGVTIDGDAEGAEVVS